MGAARPRLSLVGPATSAQCRGRGAASVRVRTRQQAVGRGPAGRRTVGPAGRARSRARASRRARSADAARTVETRVS